jgi:hypothetical protein
MDRETNVETDTWTENQTNRQAEMDRQINGQKDRQKEINIYKRKESKEVNKQTNNAAIYKYYL